MQTSMWSNWYDHKYFRWGIITFLSTLAVLKIFSPLGPDEIFFLHHAWLVNEHSGELIASYPFPLFMWILSFFSSQSLEHSIYLKTIVATVVFYIVLRKQNTMNGLNFFIVCSVLAMLILNRALDIRPESIAVTLMIFSVLLVKRIIGGEERGLFYFCFLNFMAIAASPRFLIVGAFSMLAVSYLMHAKKLNRVIIPMVAAGCAVVITHHFFVYPIDEVALAIIEHLGNDNRPDAGIVYKLGRVFGPRNLFIIAVVAVIASVLMGLKDINLRATKFIILVFFGIMVGHVSFILIFDRVPYEYVSLPLIVSFYFIVMMSIEVREAK